MGHQTGPNLRPTKNHRPSDTDTALGVPSHPGIGRVTNGREELFDEDYARLLGSYSRIDDANAFHRYVIQHMTNKYHLAPGDAISKDGRILRAGRDDELLSKIES